jgi:hypothetical protein
LFKTENGAESSGPHTAEMLCFALVFAASSSAASWAEWWRAAHHKDHAVEAHHEHLAMVAALKAKVFQLENELGEVAPLKAKVKKNEGSQRNHSHREGPEPVSRDQPCSRAGRRISLRR